MICTSSAVDVSSPVDQPRRGPLHVSLMALGTVVVKRRCRMRDEAAVMGGYPHAVIEDLHRARRVTRLQFHAHQLIRDAVIMPLDLNVIVNVRPDLLPMSKDVAFHRPGAQRRPVQLFKQAGSAGIPPLPKGPLV